MYAVLQLPEFHLQSALRLNPCISWNDPVALTKEGTAQGTIQQVTPNARKTGVYPGMSSSAALARCPQLQFTSTTPNTEKHTQSTLLQISRNLSPFVESTALGICTADLRSVFQEDLHFVLKEIIRALKSLNLHARAGLANDPDIARIAASTGSPICEVKCNADFLKALPLSALTDSFSTLQVLSDWGICSTADLLHLPKQQTLERLGSEGHRLWTLASGGRARLLLLEKDPHVFEECIEFEHEIETSEPLMFAVQRLLESLIKRLLYATRVAEKIQFKLPLEEGDPYERIFTIPSPTLDIEVLQRILFTHLESLQLARRPTAVTLNITPTRAKHAQFDLFQSALKDPNRFAETLGRLEAIVGVAHVGVPSPGNSHHPDDFTLLNAVATFESMAHGGRAPQCIQTTTDQPNFGIPLRRLRPPISAEIEMHSHRPHFIKSQLLAGPIEESRGPFRVSGNWWEKQWQIEEWDIHVSNKDILARIRRDALLRWSLEGVY